MRVDPPSWTQAWDLNESVPNAVYTVDEIGHYYEGYLRPDPRLQAIADAWNAWLDAVETAQDSQDVLKAWERFESEMDALTKEEQ
jgi:hypothetical protein